MRALFSLFVFVAPLVTSVAAPVDLSPPKSALSYADESGYLRLIQPLGLMEFERGGEGIPFRFDFSSARVDQPSVYGWRGWNCGVMEAHASLYDDLGKMRVDLLCAKVLYLDRDGPDQLTYTTANREWTARVERGVITVGRRDGWELTFVQGRVQKLVTDTGAVIHWRRDGERLLKIESEDNAVFMTVHWRGDDDGRVVDFIETVDDRYDFGFEDDYLASIRWEAKSAQPHEVALQMDSESMTIEAVDADLRTFRWNEAGLLTSDGASRYRTVPDAEAAGNGAIIERIRADGAISKRQVDRETGTVTVWLTAGGRLVTHYIRGAGPLRSSIGRIDFVDDAGTRTTMLQNRYGRNGRISERLWRGELVDAGYRQGRIEPVLYPSQRIDFVERDLARLAKIEPLRLVYDYTPAKLHTKTRVADQARLELSYDEENRLAKLVVGDRFTRSYAYLEDGAVETAVAIAPSVIDPGFTGDGGASAAPDRIVRRVKATNGKLLEEETADGQITTLTYDDENRLIRREVRAESGSLIRTQRYHFNAEEQLRFETAENHLTRLSERYLASITTEGRVLSRYSVETTPAWVVAESDPASAPVSPLPVPQ